MRVAAVVVTHNRRALLREALEDIRNGSFARRWADEQAAGGPEFAELWDAATTHSLVDAERALYERLGRRPSG